MRGQRAPVPKNWPQNLPYLASPFYSPSLSKAQLQSLRTRPAPPAAAADTSAASSPHPPPLLPEVPRDLPPGPCAAVRIAPVSDPTHPAFGQAGLFAARALAPAALVLPYLGEVHPAGAAAHAASDYDLWLDRSGDVDVAVDAARMGNEARFVNDYRGVPGAARPNAEFCEVWDVRRGERGMAVFVLPAGKKEKGKGKGGGIAKGQEILVSYGKGFWSKRRDEVELEGGEEHEKQEHVGE